MMRKILLPLLAVITGRETLPPQILSEFHSLLNLAMEDEVDPDDSLTIMV